MPRKPKIKLSSNSKVVDLGNKKKKFFDVDVLFGTKGKYQRTQYPLRIKRR